MIEPRLDKLPQELIEQVASEAVDYFDDEDDQIFRDKLADLANLTRTCKRLHDACTPYLFRQVTFQWCDNRLLYFLQTLISKPYLRTYVQVFKARGWRPGGKEEVALKEVAKGLLESDPVARLLRREDPSSLWDIVAACTLRLLPDLVALTTSPLVMQLATQWPEEQRLHGSSISALQLVHDGRPRKDTFDNYCEHMFEWKMAFQPGKTPAALHLLRLGHQNCQRSRMRFKYNRSQLDLESLHIAASLRRLDLQAWGRGRDDEPNCMPIGTLNKCTSLTHLTFIDEDAWVDEMVDVICQSETLMTSLQTLEIRMKWYSGWIDAETLWHISRFTCVTSLTLPWIDIEVDTPLESTLWPPSLVSLTMTLTALEYRQLTSPRAIMKAEHFPATMQDITFEWSMDESEGYRISTVLDLIDFSRALDERFASSGIVIVHAHYPPEDFQCSNPRSTITNIERDFLLPLLRRRLAKNPEVTYETQLRVDAILNVPSHVS